MKKCKNKKISIKMLPLDLLLGLRMSQQKSEEGKKTARPTVPEWCGKPLVAVERQVGTADRSQWLVKC
jgi:hypothetical protein